VTTSLLSVHAARRDAVDTTSQIEFLM
jgi:hypothetical protein